MFHSRAVTIAALAALTTVIPYPGTVSAPKTVLAGEHHGYFPRADGSRCSRCDSAECYGNCSEFKHSVRLKLKEHKAQKREKHRRERFLQLLSRLNGKKLYHREWTPFCVGHFGYFQTSWRPAHESPMCNIYTQAAAQPAAGQASLPQVNAVPPVPSMVQRETREPNWAADPAAGLIQQQGDSWESEMDQVPQIIPGRASDQQVTDESDGWSRR